MNDFELQRYINLFISYEENKIKARKRFEKDLFVCLSILTIICIVIMITSFKIESYLEYIMKSVIALEYK